MKVRSFFSIAFGTSTVFMAILIANGQQQEKKSPSSPVSGMSNMQDEKMNERGDHVMGFDHTKTTHHFRLLSDGGSIEVKGHEGKGTKVSVAIPLSVHQPVFHA